MTNGIPDTEEALTREIDKLQRLIGKQAVAIELLKKNRRPGREAVTLVEALRETGCSVAAACRLAGLSRSGYYAARQGAAGSGAAPDPSDREMR